MNKLGHAAGLAGVLLLLSVPAGVRAQAISGAEDGWRAVTRCAGIANDVQRHACVDEVLRSAGLMASPEAKAADRRQGFGLQLPAHKPPQPKPVQEARATPEPKAKAAKPAKAPSVPPPVESEDRIQVTLGKVTMDGDGKLVLTTTDGAIWKQVESEAVRPTPAAGQAMAIEKASFGGFMCKPGRWTAFRCIRTP